MGLSSINVRNLTLLGAVLLTPGAFTQPAEAGDLFGKKGQLIAVPVATASAPVSIMQGVAAAPAQVMVLQQAPTTASIVSVPVQKAVAQPTGQAQFHPQAAPSTPPAIHITVIEADAPKAAPTAQAVPTAQAAPSAQVQVQAVPQQAQVQVQAIPQVQYVTVQPQIQVVPVAAAPVVLQQVAAPQAALPVQLYYVPAPSLRSKFKKH